MEEGSKGTVSASKSFRYITGEKVNLHLVLKNRLIVPDVADRVNTGDSVDGGQSSVSPRRGPVKE